MTLYEISFAMVEVENSTPYKFVIAEPSVEARKFFEKTAKKDLSLRALQTLMRQGREVHATSESFWDSYAYIARLLPGAYLFTHLHLLSAVAVYVVKEALPVYCSGYKLA